MPAKIIQFQVTGPREIVVLLDDGTLAVTTFERKNNTIDIGQIKEIVSGANVTIVGK